MKHTFFLIIASICLYALLPGCDAGGKSKSGFAGAKEENFDKEASYALGLDIATNLKENYFYPNIEEFAQGMSDVFSEAGTRYTLEEAYFILEQAVLLIQEQRDRTENNFLAENSNKPGISITPSGLQYEIITEGNGPKPEAADIVRVHYEGALTNGKVFDSSYARGIPVEFSLEEVIPGWAEGLQLMNVGSKYRLFIPSNLGYGLQDMGQIPPNSALIFVVELLDIIR